MCASCNHNDDPSYILVMTWSNAMRLIPLSVECSVARLPPVPVGRHVENLPPFPLTQSPGHVWEKTARTQPAFIGST